MITLDDQLKLWLEGKSVHTSGAGPHNLRTVSLPGTEGRQWKCLDCGAKGSLTAIRAEKCPMSDGECCPDFSCCYPALQMSLEDRIAYVERQAAKTAASHQ